MKNKQYLNEVKQLQKIAGLLKEGHDMEEESMGVDQDKINNDVKQLIVMSIRHFNGLAKQGDLTSDHFANGNLLGYMESFDDSADDDFDLTPEESSAFSSVWQNVMKKAKAEAAAGGLNTLKDYVSFLNKEAAGLGESKSDNLNEWDPDKDWDETDDEEEDDDNGMPSDEELWGTSRSKRR